MRRTRKILRGDVERLVCSNVASGNADNVAELASIAIETMLLRARLAMKENELRNEYNRALSDSDHTYKLMVKLTLEPKDTEEIRLEKWATEAFGEGTEKRTLSEICS